MIFLQGANGLLRSHGKYLIILDPEKSPCLFYIYRGQSNFGAKRVNIKRSKPKHPCFNIGQNNIWLHAYTARVVVLEILKGTRRGRAREARENF
jgi:hypothetical protein